MSRTAQRVLTAILIALLLTSGIPCHAAPPVLSAEAYVLMDADSGRVLLSHNETQEKAIASTTKIMTALVALEHGSLDDTVTVKRSHLKEGSSMYLNEGETLTLEALLYGLMLPSGNDAAECIADHCGGDVETFVGWMNEKAAALGMEHTSFQNPSGLDAEGHHSCAIDMARLAAFAVSDPTFLRLCSTETARTGTRSMSNHNKLLASCPGCIGLKTGYTGAAGRTLVTCCERDGLRLVAVTLHDSSDWQDHAAMYDYGFSAFRSARCVRRGDVCATVAVRGGAQSMVRAAAERSYSYPLAEGESLSTRLELADSVAAPVAAGERLGELVVSLNGEEIGRIALTAEDPVDAVPVRQETGLFVRLLNRFRKAG